MACYCHEQRKALMTTRTNRGLVTELFRVLDAGEPLLAMFPTRQDDTLILPDTVSDEMEFYANDVAAKRHGVYYTERIQTAPTGYLWDRIEKLRAGLQGWCAIGVLTGVGPDRARLIKQLNYLLDQGAPLLTMFPKKKHRGYHEPPTNVSSSMRYFLDRVEDRDNGNSWGNGKGYDTRLEEEPIAHLVNRVKLCKEGLDE